LQTVYVPDKNYVWSEPNSSESSRPSSPAAVEDSCRTGGGGVDEASSTAEDKHSDALSMLKLAGYPVSMHTSACY
jgi:hypothetical protein